MDEVTVDQTTDQALAEIAVKKQEALAEIDEYAKTLMPYINFAKVALQVDINTEDLKAIHRIINEGLPANSDAALAGKVSTNSDEIAALRNDMTNFPAGTYNSLVEQVNMNTQDISNLILYGGTGGGGGGSVPDTLVAQIVKNSEDIEDLMVLFDDFLTGES